MKKRLVCLIVFMLLSLTACSQNEANPLNGKETFTLKNEMEYGGIELEAVIGYPKKSGITVEDGEDDSYKTLSNTKDGYEMTVYLCYDSTTYDENQAFAKGDLHYEEKMFSGFEGYVVQLFDSSIEVNVYLDYLEYEDVYLYISISNHMDVDFDHRKDVYELYQLPEIQEILQSIVYTPQGEARPDPKNFSSEEEWDDSQEFADEEEWDDLQGSSDEEEWDDSQGFVDEAEWQYGSAPESNYEWWSGEWYGWWCIRNGSGEYEQFNNIAWDAYAIIEDYGAGMGGMTFWDSETGRDNPLVICEMLFDAGQGEHGTMNSAGGAFYVCDSWLPNVIAVNPVEIKPLEWKIDPADSSVSHFEDMFEITGTYVDPLNADNHMDYFIYLRPWGTNWEDVKNGDTSGCIYSDMMPVQYDTWYEPLMILGLEYLPASYQDGLSILAEE